VLYSHDNNKNNNNNNKMINSEKNHGIYIITDLRIIKKKEENRAK